MNERDKKSLSKLFPMHEFTVNRRNVEHPELTEAISIFNRKVGSSEKMQQQIWLLWRFNMDVCVPTVEGYQPPYDWGLIPTDRGATYTFYTETRLICEGDKPYIAHVPFREILDRVYRLSEVNGIYINPRVNNEPSPYTIGLSEDLLRQMCQKDMMMIDGKIIGAD